MLHDYDQIRQMKTMSINNNLDVRKKKYISQKWLWYGWIKSTGEKMENSAIQLATERIKNREKERKYRQIVYIYWYGLSM